MQNHHTLAALGEHAQAASLPAARIELARLRVALVHDWFDGYLGSERVVEQMLKVLPQADVHCTVDFMPPGERAFLDGHRIITSFIAGLPFARRRFRAYLPLMPLAVEQFDLSGYDLVVSSSHAVAKGVLTGPDQLHVSYLHTPMRYAWDHQHTYLKQRGLDRGLLGWLARRELQRLRQWDARSANGVDHFFANSDFIRRRIRKTYRREAEVLHPPVALHQFTPRADKGDYYVVIARLVPYKRVDLVVEAFNRMPQRRLLVVGDGPEAARIRALARSPGIELRGFLPRERMIECLAGARAFVYAAEEDFGITLVEAQACATPLIALARGGAVDIVRDLDGGAPPTGVLFAAQDADAIVDAVERFEHRAGEFQAAAIRRNAERFSEERFREQFALRLAALYRRHREELGR